ncbi:germin-like protein subfamily T member 2 [Mercurialis annua]|uniref:germin-like protein subfamily T member 2 n=1 Tax=Mercurialis annua TaxID=3986 RepID=UPI0021601E9A|nr:germin-like protein subfamily T member 2 [Mercurialis annua]
MEGLKCIKLIYKEPPYPYPSTISSFYFWFIPAMASSSFFRVLCSSIMLLLLPMHIISSDPDPLQDFCVADLKGSVSINGFPCKLAAEVTSDDFFFTGLSKEGNTTNKFGWAATPANVLAFPGLNTLGISMNRVDFAPGGLNPPHSHPRATETGVVIQGKLLVGFVTTSNVFHSKVLSPGEMFVVPRGLVHFQLNVGEGKALLFTAFNSQLPGSAVASTTLFASAPEIPNQVLTKAFQVDDGIINTIKSKFRS